MNKTVNRQKAGLIMYHESGDELHWLVVTPEFYQKVKDLIESVPNEKWTNEVDFNMFRNVFDMFYYPEDEVGRGGLYVPEIIEHDFTQTWCRFVPDFLNKYEFIGMITIPSY